MSKKRLRGAAALDAVAQAPPNMVAEVLDGELHTSPRPRIRHARASSVLGVILGGSFDGDSEPGGWILLDEPELHLGEEPDILVPDLAGWRREHMPQLPDHAFLELAPDWACEVLSPSTEGIDRVKKRAIYAREGVTHLWFVAPEAKVLEVFALDAGGYRLLDSWAAQALVYAPPFEALGLSLAELWLS
ncbi:hypothetical protein ENSA5_02340 [Enhygromyxa salina]|uniref:Putative restriction endonuclease domain-containing protein n=1 Tax=Enhygromyxa salina TaxID=215803 RepID=A0A2S9YK22_9BACT|nr:Uma2 family endonuclease [Enhygromyxa salina]PRQ05457.1 hypothetical protein ENSA5_02340 [Enhygromyxa salina]